MRWMLCCALFVFVSCAPVPEVVSLPELPAEQLLLGTGYPAKWSAVPRTGQSAGVSVLSWSCTFTHIGKTPVVSLLISCLDNNGNVLAAWDTRVSIVVGATTSQSGKFDIPTADVMKIKTVTVKPVAEEPRP